MRYPRLFEPCKIGGLQIPNRIVMPPMTTNLAKDGAVTDTMVDYYAERGHGGVGLVVVEDAFIDSSIGRRSGNDLIVDHDKWLPGLERLARAIRKGGAKAALNLNHAGRRWGSVQSGQLLVSPGRLPVGPSPLPHPASGYVVPQELSINGIEELEDEFVQAARRVRQAGFDMVCLHAAHLYLISQFLSPLSNHRTDIYGRDSNGRLRFLLEIVKKIKLEIGSDYPIMVRINGVDDAEGRGVTIDDAKEISRRLEASGVNAISVSAGSAVPVSSREHIFSVAPMRLPRACLVHLAAELKQAVSIPVMTANRIITPALAEEILEQGKADIIGIGRGLIADPEWPWKAREGREDTIRHCTSCLHCQKRVRIGLALRCAVNATAGQESELRIYPAVKRKTVFIAGAGPGGMEAARVAALRGHKVRLFESEKLGGQLNLACVPPGKGEWRLFLDFEKDQLNRLGIIVEEKALTPCIVNQERPDAVIVATGATPSVPHLPGIQKKNVKTAWEILREKFVPEGRVAVLGGGQVGAETAEYLAEKGCDVTIIEMRDEIAGEMHDSLRKLLLFRLEDLGVKVLTETRAEQIEDRGIVVHGRSGQQFVDANAIVLALGARPNQQLAEELRETRVELHLVGDCAEVRHLPEAVEDGFKAGLTV